MDSRELKEQCLALPGAVEEFPFGDLVSVFKVGGKMFALSHLDGEPLQLSVKCDPELAAQLRATYPVITPGYHLNKRHWNTITLDGSLPDEMVTDLLGDSYDLVVASLPKARRPPGLWWRPGDAMWYRAGVDLVVVIHLLFIGFVVGGVFLAWRWPRIVWVHIPVAIYGALVEFVGFTCPLTLLENYLRRRAGQAGYQGGFIDHYLVKVIYPPGLTRGMQIGLGLGVLLVAFLGYRGFLRRHRPGLTKSA